MAMTFQLKDFDGPLDLLLFLINKEKIDIKDIFVSQITDQYIDSVRNAPDLDMDDATDFLVMAATLLEIKSRAMLPRPPRIEEGEEDPEEALIRRLEEYKRFRETASAMKQFEQAAANLFTKLPVVHGVNAILGGALGLVKGALLLFFAVWLLRRFQILVTPELIGQTYILRFFAEHSPMELITSL